jgi:ABC-2 type transport system ATP-binding protein
MVIDRGQLVFDGGFEELHREGDARRTVVVDLAAPADPLAVEGATVTRIDGARQSLSLPAGASAAPVVAALGTRDDLVDLSIQEPAIEDVITSLYSR